MDKRGPSDEVAALREENAFLRAAFEAMHVGVILADAQGKPVLANAAGRRILGAVPEAAAEAQPPVFLRPDKVTPIPAHDLPAPRALRGERVLSVASFVRPADGSEGFWVEGSASPVRGASSDVLGVVAEFLDVSEEKQLELDLAARNEALQLSEQENAALVARLQAAVRDLSTPILELWDDVLAVPIIGVVDSRRGAEIMDRLLDRVVERGAAFVIVDLTGVDMVDTQTAAIFVRLAAALSLVGAQSVLTGIRPSVAQALIGLGLDLGRLTMLRTLKHGLLHCLRRRSAPRAGADGAATEPARDAPAGGPPSRNRP